jgi:hypothetical protein
VLSGAAPAGDRLEGLDLAVLAGDHVVDEDQAPVAGARALFGGCVSGGCARLFVDHGFLRGQGALAKRLREIKGRRSRYQEMAAAGLIDFDELRERHTGIEDERGDTERTLEAIQRRAEHLERLEQNRNVLLEEYAGAVPMALGALAPEERHRVYRILRLRAVLAPSGDLEMSGDVMPASFCRTETSYQRG